MNNKKASAYAQVVNYLEDIGLGSLAQWAANQLRSGKSPQQLYSAMRETPEYKKIFVGNEMRVKNGLPPLSEGNYLQLQRDYTATLRAAGLPKDFYNDPEDFAKWMAQEVSPAELADRARLAADTVRGFSPEEKEALRRYYGVGTKQLMAWALNPKKALPSIQKAAEVARMGGAAISNGMNVSGGYLADLVEQDVSTEEARQAFAQVGEQKGVIRQLGEIDGVRVSQQDQVDAALGLNSKAARATKKLASRERSRFEETSAATGSTFSTGGSSGY